MNKNERKIVMAALNESKKSISKDIQELRKSFIKELDQTNEHLNTLTVPGNIENVKARVELLAKKTGDIKKDLELLTNKLK